MLFLYTLIKVALKQIILVIDDDKEIRQLLKAILTEAGYDVRTTISGEDGLASVRAARPDLILADIEMPGLDGYGFTERLRSDELLSKLPLILVTAHNKVKDIAKGLRLGADDHVAKPFDSRELISRIKLQLDPAR